MQTAKWVEYTDRLLDMELDTWSIVRNLKMAISILIMGTCRHILQVSAFSIPVHIVLGVGEASVCISTSVLHIGLVVILNSTNMSFNVILLFKTTIWNLSLIFIPTSANLVST